MNQPVTLLPKDAPINSEIRTRIQVIQAAEQNIPGVIIIIDLRTSCVVYMSKRGRDILDVTMEELVAMGPNYHERFFNPEDAKEYVPKVLGMLQRNNDEEIISFFQQVRQSPKHDWNWYHSSTRIFHRDEHGNPILTITLAQPVDDKHRIAAKAQRLLEENNFLRHNHPAFDSLTKREKEILQMMAKGLSSAQMAKQLFISETTAATHRKNIKRKLNIQSNYDVARFAYAFDLI